jgi:hypothetical protein
MKELGIEYWEYDDGTVGAQFEGVPGNIYAKNAQILMTAINWLAQSVLTENKRAKKAKAKMRKLDVGMQGQWIDGMFTVRFLPVPGFGVSFEKAEQLQTWLKHLITIVSQPATKTHD